MEPDPSPGIDKASEHSEQCDDKALLATAEHKSVLGTQAVVLDVTAVINPPPGLFASVTQDDSKKDERDSSVPSFIEVQLPGEGSFSIRTHWSKELMIMLKLAMPCIMANTSTQIMVVTNQIFVGHIGVDEFAAAALANTWFNLLWSFMLGASTAMDTLASQAYGTKDYRSLLVWTYSGLIINTLFCFPLMGALWVGEHAAAVLFHQGYGPVAILVSDFCKALIPGLWPLIWSLILMKFLQTQNSMGMPAIIVGVACVINIGFNFGLVGTFGFVGSPWATTACRVLQCILMLVACIYQQHKAIKRANLTWADWWPMSWAAFKTACHPSILWEHGKLALAGGIMNAFEASAFDVTTAFAGALGVTATAAHAALLSLCSFCFNALPFAISIAATIRCGNLLGAGRPKQARLAGLLSMVLGVAFQGATGVVLGASNGQVVRVFTSDPEVLQAVKGIAWLAMIFQFSDGLFGTAQGVLRAMGGQVGCVLYNALGFWGGGVLVGWLLTFKGLWVGLLSGDVFATILSVMALSRCDWHAAAVKLFTEVEQAALNRAAEGSLREQLEAEEAEGFITHVDMSDFSKEMMFFIVMPPEEEAQTLDTPEQGSTTAPHTPMPASRTHSVAAVLSGLKSGSPYSFVAAPGMMMQTTRAGSIAAALLANSRMVSITAAQHAAAMSHFRQELVDAHQGSLHRTSDPLNSPHAGHDECRNSNTIRLMRPSVFGARGSMERHHDGNRQQQDRSSGHSLDFTATFLRTHSHFSRAPSHIAAALSRGANIEHDHSPGLFKSLHKISAIFGRSESLTNDLAKKHPLNSSSINRRSSNFLRLGSLTGWRGGSNSGIPSMNNVDRSSARSSAGMNAGRLAATLSRGGSFNRSSNTRGTSVSGTPSAAMPLPLMPLPGVIIMPPSSSQAIQIPTQSKDRQDAPATTSQLMSAMEQGLPSAQEPKPATRDARHWSLRRTIMKTNIKSNVQDKNRVRHVVIQEPAYPSAGGAGGSATPVSFVLGGSAPEAGSGLELAGLGPIARAARQGSGEQSHGANMLAAMAPATLPVIAEGGSGHLPPPRPDQGGAPGVDAMSTEQLSQIMAMLSNELARRQQQ